MKEVDKTTPGYKAGQALAILIYAGIGAILIALVIKVVKGILGI